MQERENKSSEKKNENLNSKNLATYIRDYARNCRYSFNRMLNA